MRGLLLFSIAVLAAAVGVVLFLVSYGGKIAGTEQPNSKVVAADIPIKTPETRRRAEVPILMYHYIRDYKSETDPLGVQLSVSPAAFRAQLQALKRDGYSTISLSEFAKGNFGSKPIVLTFDDGYEDHFTTALPILQELNYTATFFIVKNFIGRPGYLSAAQISMLQDAGMEIGGHSTNHANLSKMTYEKAVADISSSLAGRDNVFSYPSGQYTYETLDVVSGLGVTAAVTTEQGVATTETNLLELPRIRVKEKTDLISKIAELRDIQVPSKASQPPAAEVELQE
ncbi:MAG: polysaccharide deacetylase family protein [Candidatus Berkelbacteria bacterium]|nr:MAG: polysaccharide deacetylase family protein [Candidatus Berkelbacteria bacterium]QQG51934.1 MAG: polysaccharide deacetylase family protein [Candidatus Berkelbacteria bacterium]